MVLTSEVARVLSSALVIVAWVDRHALGY